MKGKQDVARIVKYHRKKAGLSQHALAKLAGGGKTAVFDLEKGKETIQLDTLKKILNAINITITYEGPLMKDYEQEGINEAREVLVNGTDAGTLEERQRGVEYIFRYHKSYSGPPVSLTMPTDEREYEFDRFPPFFDGVLPEGVMLDGLLRQRKIDKNDLFSQLLAVGSDLVGAVTVEEMT